MRLTLASKAGLAVAALAIALRVAPPPGLDFESSALVVLLNVGDALHFVGLPSVDRDPNTPVGAVREKKNSLMRFGGRTSSFAPILQFTQAAVEQAVTIEGVPCLVFTPEDMAVDDGPYAAVVYLHGGGWVIGNAHTHEAVTADLARLSRTVVVSVDYRLAPEHKFPAAVHDSAAVVAWVASPASASLGIDGSRVFVAGDSAGGNLAVVSQLYLRQQSSTHSPLLGQVLIYPAVNARMSAPSQRMFAHGYHPLTASLMRWFYGHYLNGPHDVDNILVSPQLASDDVLAVLPRTLVVTAEFDPLRDEGEEFSASLRALGVDSSTLRYNGTVHGFISVSFLKPAQVCVSVCLLCVRLMPVMGMGACLRDCFTHHCPLICLLSVRQVAHRRVDQRVSSGCRCKQDSGVGFLRHNDEGDTHVGG
jgi:acetyl esterase